MNGQPARLLVPQHEALVTLGDISRTTLWELANSGELVRVRIGRRSFVTAESIKEYVERLKVAARAS